MGGRLFTSPGHVPAGVTKKFAVCPYGFPAGEAAALERANACFAAVHPACRVTLYWLNSCYLVRVRVAWEMPRARAGRRA